MIGTHVAEGWIKLGLASFLAPRKVTVFASAIGRVSLQVALRYRLCVRFRLGGSARHPSSSASRRRLLGSRGFSPADQTPSRPPFIIHLLRQETLPDLVFDVFQPTDQTRAPADQKQTNSPADQQKRDKPLRPKQPRRPPFLYPFVSRKCRPICCGTFFVTQDISYRWRAISQTSTAQQTTIFIPVCKQEMLPDLLWHRFRHPGHQLQTEGDFPDSDSPADHHFYTRL